MSNIFRNFGVFVREIALAGEEIIPKPIWRQPASLVIWTKPADVTHEAKVWCGLIFHKAEHCALCCSVVFRYSRKQFDCHRMNWAEKVNSFADFIIQARHVRKERTDVSYNGFALVGPMLRHAVANVNRASNQVKRCILRNMELHLMESVGDQLIAIRSKIIHHFLGFMDDKHHVQRLDLCKLGQLLKNCNIIAV